MRASQLGSYNHRHEGLYVRVSDARRKGISIPEKRYGKKAVSLEIVMVQKLRRITRKKSLEVWSQTKSAVVFDKKMLKVLFYLRQLSRVTRYKRAAIKRLKGLLK